MQPKTFRLNTAAFMVDSVICHAMEWRWNEEGHNLSNVVYWFSLRKKEWLNSKDKEEETGRENCRSCLLIETSRDQHIQSYLF